MRDFALLVPRVLVAAILIAAGAMKVGHIADLASAIATFRLLPAQVIAPLAATIPVVELLTGACLLFGLFARAAAAVAAVLLLAYGMAIASALLRGLPANCGCFGSGAYVPPDWAHVALNSAIALVAAVVWWLGPGHFSLDARRLARVQAHPAR